MYLGILVTNSWYYIHQEIDSFPVGHPGDDNDVDSIRLRSLGRIRGESAGIDSIRNDIYIFGADCGSENKVFLIRMRDTDCLMDVRQHGFEYLVDMNTSSITETEEAVVGIYCRHSHGPCMEKSHVS